MARPLAEQIEMLRTDAGTAAPGDDLLGLIARATVRILPGSEFSLEDLDAVALEETDSGGTPTVIERLKKAQWLVLGERENSLRIPPVGPGEYHCDLLVSDAYLRRIESVPPAQAPDEMRFLSDKIEGMDRSVPHLFEAGCGSVARQRMETAFLALCGRRYLTPLLQGLGPRPHGALETRIKTVASFERLYQGCFECQELWHDDFSLLARLTGYLRGYDELLSRAVRQAQDVVVADTLLRTGGKPAIVAAAAAKRAFVRAAAVHHAIEYGKCLVDWALREFIPMHSQDQPPTLTDRLQAITDARSCVQEVIRGLPRDTLSVRLLGDCISRLQPDYRFVQPPSQSRSGFLGAVQRDVAREATVRLDARSVKLFLGAVDPNQYLTRIGPVDVLIQVARDHGQRRIARLVARELIARFEGPLLQLGYDFPNVSIDLLGGRDVYRHLDTLATAYLLLWSPGNLAQRFGRLRRRLVRTAAKESTGPRGRSVATSVQFSVQTLVRVMHLVSPPMRKSLRREIGLWMSELVVSHLAGQHAYAFVPVLEELADWNLGFHVGSVSRWQRTLQSSRFVFAYTQDPYSLYSRAWKALQRHNPEEALRLFRSVQKCLRQPSKRLQQWIASQTAPDLPRLRMASRMGEARALARMDRHVAALRILRTLGTNEPADFHALAALSYVDLGLPAEAAREGQIALEKEPLNASYLLNQVAYLVRAGKLDEVRTVIGPFRGTGLWDDLLEGGWQSIDISENQSRLARGADAAKALARKMRTNDMAQVNAAIALQMAGLPDEALRFLPTDLRKRDRVAARLHSLLMREKGGSGERMQRLLLTLPIGKEALFPGKPMPLPTLNRIVGDLLDSFKHVMEKDGCHRIFWRRSAGQREDDIRDQFRIYCGVRCEMQSIAMKPNAQAGTGCVDLEFLASDRVRAHVEFKLDTNSAWQRGLTKQLPSYIHSKRFPVRGYYVLATFRKPGNSFRRKLKRLERLALNMQRRQGLRIRVIGLDLHNRPSPSQA